MPNKYSDWSFFIHIRCCFQSWTISNGFIFVCFFGGTPTKQSSIMWGLRCFFGHKDPTFLFRFLRSAQSGQVGERNQISRPTFFWKKKHPTVFVKQSEDFFPDVLHIKEINKNDQCIVWISIHSIMKWNGLKPHVCPWTYRNPHGHKQRWLSHWEMDFSYMDQ